MNILFICSKNKWRSRTAETIFKNNGLHQIRSAGTKDTARIKINQQLIDWSNLVITMETHHKKFNNLSEIIVLDILDEYEYMDSELIDLLHLKTDEIIFE